MAEIDFDIFGIGKTVRNIIGWILIVVVAVILLFVLSIVQVFDNLRASPFDITTSDGGTVKLSRMYADAFSLETTSGKIHIPNNLEGIDRLDVIHVKKAQAWGVGDEYTLGIRFPSGTVVMGKGFPPTIRGVSSEIGNITIPYNKVRVIQRQ